MDKIRSNWTGSEKTFDLVRRQILDRWGENEASNYDPHCNCLTFKQWLEYGFKVKRGEKALKSFIVVEQKNDKGQIICQYPKQINLFYIRQVEKLNSAN